MIPITTTKSRLDQSNYAKWDAVVYRQTGKSLILEVIFSMNTINTPKYTNLIQFYKKGFMFYRRTFLISGSNRLRSSSRNMEMQS